MADTRRGRISLSHRSYQGPGLSGGENVYPAEVEEALRRHPAVVDAAVFGRKRPMGEVVADVVELAPGQQLTPDALISELDPGWHPKDTSGNSFRRLCRERLPARSNEARVKTTSEVMKSTAIARAHGRTLALPGK
jgi:acyl-CoA synthetase (AMP-forming)/AMP-acid ligase II